MALGITREQKQTQPAVRTLETSVTAEIVSMVCVGVRVTRSCVENHRALTLGPL